MQSQFFDKESEASETEVKASATSETRFHCHFEDSMEMYADAATVAEYLDLHQGWFCDCAQPMKVEPIECNSYALVIGRFGAFGYEVEPKIGLELLPADGGVYRIRTVPVPDYVAPGYDVDYRATMNLVEKPMDGHLAAMFSKGDSVPKAISSVEWQLDLEVRLQFPKFIHKLSQSLIQSTGDRLLLQIVRQVSRRLTHKVQEDFHKKLNLPIPKKSKTRK